MTPELYDFPADDLIGALADELQPDAMMRTCRAQLQIRQIAARRLQAFDNACQIELRGVEPTGFICQYTARQIIALVVLINGKLRQQ